MCNNLPNLYTQGTNKKLKDLTSTEKRLVFSLHFEDFLSEVYRLESYVIHIKITRKSEMFGRRIDGAAIYHGFGGHCK